MNNKRKIVERDIDSLASAVKDINLKYSKISNEECNGYTSEIEERSPTLQASSELPVQTVENFNETMTLEKRVEMLEERLRKAEDEILLGKVMYREMLKKVNDNALINRVLSNLFEVDVDSYLNPSKRKKKDEEKTPKYNSYIG